ncbi:MAG: hypothetical protein AAB819_00410, partial [Patescibacteria group bacterium]
MKHSSHVPIFLAGIFFLGSALIPSITSAQWFPYEGGYCRLTEDPNVNFCVFDPSLYAQFGIVPSAIGGTPPPQTGTPPPQTGTPPPQTGTPP